MMIAAVYVRKSTEQTGIADDQKSVARQLDHARQYAARKGWTVDDQYVFCDDGISGAEFTNRPGFLRLMNALKPRAPFQVLIMSEESRLGREAIETAYALKQLITAGVRVFFYLEDRERTLDSPTDKIMLSLTAFADELEREKARQRTYDAMLRKARAGHVTGGACFGYTNVRVDGHVEREIHDAQAAVIREIFRLCAAGSGFRDIAHRLNAQHAPCPRGQQQRPTGWSPSSVRDVLYRPLYRGQIVWNRTRKRDTWGQHRQHARPGAEWLQVDAPHLRIVTEALWNAAHERLRTSRETYLRTNDGQLFGKPSNGIESKYLLTGLAQCGICGGGLYTTSRSHGRQRAYLYACATFHKRGSTICPNNQSVWMADTDTEVMAAVQDEILDPVVVEAALQEAFETLTAPASVARLPQWKARIAELDREMDRLTLAIASGGELSVLTNGVKARELERRRLQTDCDQLESWHHAGRVNVREVQRELRKRADDWRVMAARNVSQGRQILRKLLDGRVTITPRDHDTCELSGRASYGKLFSGIVATAMASPRGTVRDRKLYLLGCFAQPELAA
jgi:site-specific DNA recombinase